MPRRYPRSSGVRSWDLIASGRKVADVARNLGVSDQTIYNWQKQDGIDRGERPGLRSEEIGELQAARRQIAELQAELAATRRANELLKVAVPQKAGSPPSPRWLARDTRSRSPAGCSKSPSRGSTPTCHGLRLLVRSARRG